MPAALPAQTANVRPDVWAQPVELDASENFFKVTDDLYRAAQPTAAAMQAYEKFGIRTVINLRGFHSDKDEMAGTNMRLVELPTHTWAADDDEYVAAVLQAIRQAEKPVLVHCQYGADRTGMVMAVYRMVEQGWNREAALDEMLNGGFGFHSVWINISDYVRNVDIDKIRQLLNQN